MTNNDLDALPTTIFDGLSALLRLDLANNDLDALPATIFVGLTALLRLDLANNDLDALPATIFDGLDRLATLRMVDNPFTADTGLPAGIFDDVLDTLGPIATTGNSGFVIDQTVRDAHFVCSRSDFLAIAAAGVNDCLRVTSAQFNAYLARLVENGATLSNLAISDGALTPVFAPAVADYAVTVFNRVTAVTVTPTAAGAGATITVNTVPVVSGAPSEDIVLPTPGMAVPITIEVTSAGITGTYGLMVTRATLPGITGIALTSNAGDDNVYANGDAIEATVTFSKAVTVTGQPQLALTVGTAARQAVYARGSMTPELVFSYTVAGNDEDDDGVSIGINALTHTTGAGGSAILDADDATVDALITHSVTVDAPNAHAVDGIVPRVDRVVISSVTGPYALGETIELTATFSEAVTVDTAADLPRIPLMVGTAPRPAVYDSGRSTTTVLVFRYTVVDDDSDPNGFEVAGSALELNNSAIRDAAGNDAILAHAAIVAADANRVDTAAPTVSSASVNADSLTLNYNEPLDQASVPANGAYALTATPGPAPAVTDVAINGDVVTLTLNAAVTHAQTVMVSYTPGGAPVRDVAGNNAALLDGGAMTTAAPAPVATAPVNQSYAVGSAIIPLTLAAGPSNPGETTYTLTGPNAGPGDDDLPAGLAFAPATRILSGTPTTVGAVTLTYTVSDGVSTDTATFVTITTLPPVAMLTGTLTEANLFAATAPTVTVTLANTEYEAAPGTLMQSHFSVTDTVAGTVRVSDFTRDSATVATLTLAYSGEDITTTGTLSVTLAAAGHTVADDLMTGSIAITASAGANICGRTAQVRTAILATSSATECTSVGNLAMITVLDLNNMGITALRSGDFAGLSVLQTLNLYENALVTLDAGLFAGLSALETLNLYENALVTLDADLFAGLSALQTLNLYHNALDTLDADLFAGLTALETLNLGRNNLSPDADLFAGLTALETLNLSYNALDTLDADLFAGLTRLTGLRLDNNNLRTLPADLFDGLTALETLSLSFNRLNSLEANLFDGLDSLENLGLVHNPFTAGTGLPAGIFDDVLDTLGPDTFDDVFISLLGPGNDISPTDLEIDRFGRNAHFVCSRADAAAIVMATTGMTDCLRISSAQLNTAIPLVEVDATLSGLTLSDGTDTLPPHPGVRLRHHDLYRRRRQQRHQCDGHADRHQCRRHDYRQRRHRRPAAAPATPLT